MANALKVYLEEDEELKELYEDDYYDIDTFMGDVSLNLPKDVSDNVFEDEKVYKVIKEKLISSLSFVTEEDLELVKELQDVKKVLEENPKEIFYQLFDSVKLTGSVDQMLDFIKTHPNIMKDKYLIIGKPYLFNYESYITVKEDIEKITKETGIMDVRIILDGNLEPIKLEEFAKSFSIIDDIVKNIESLDLSPIEQVMMAYDICKNRVYVSEKKGEKPSKSRDLVSTLLTNTIVCVGYTNIFITIINKLGFKATDFSIKEIDETNSCHVRPVVWIEDPKYGINGLYFFDPTWDSKRKDSGIESMNSYKCFARSVDEMRLIDREQGLESVAPYLNPKFINKIKAEYGDEIIAPEIAHTNYNRRLNSLLKMGGHDPLEVEFYINKAKLLEKYYLVIKDMSHIIEPETFFEILYNVRKKMYYLNPEETPFTKEDFIESVFSNKFKYYIFNKSEKTIAELFYGSLKEYLIAKKKGVYNTKMDDTFEKEVEAIKLTRTLRSILMNKEK